MTKSQSSFPIWQTGTNKCSFLRTNTKEQELYMIELFKQSTKWKKNQHIINDSGKEQYTEENCEA
jgi:hypothetical protein